MASTAGVGGWRGLGAYVAAQYGIVGLTRSAALDYATQGIRISAIDKGPDVILNCWQLDAALHEAGFTSHEPAPVKHGNRRYILFADGTFAPLND